MTKTPAATEANFDGIVGPTHNYGGLSVGNLASMANEGAVSNPREAALQGLAKAKALADLGVLQCVLPPQERPDIRALRRLGFTDSRDEDILARAMSEAPALLEACSSASSMWTANAATVSPAADCADGRTHFTPANLVSKLHRSLESTTTSRALRAIFANDKFFAHHPPLPATPDLGDEGAANHTRLCADYGGPGLEFFVYGRRASVKTGPAPTRFPARQTLEASSSVARLHGLSLENTVFGQQNPLAIDQGAFHNDVVAVGNLDFLFFHDKAFLNEGDLISLLRQKFETVTGETLRLLRVTENEVPLDEAVRSYLFNSQLVRTAKGKVILVAPQESEETLSVRGYLDDITGRSEGAISEVVFKNLRQSMRNGGGPACLRLRVVLDSASQAAMNQGVILSDQLYGDLVNWVKDHYRDKLTASDLADPALLTESRTALDRLTQLLKLGSIYPFQIAELGR